MLVHAATPAVGESITVAQVRVSQLFPVAPVCGVQVATAVAGTLLVVHVRVVHALPMLATAGALAPVQFCTKPLVVTGAHVVVVQLLPDVAAAGVLVPVQVCTAVGPVLLSLHVVVVNELPELGDAGVQVCTGVGPVLTVLGTTEHVVAT
jgi:hypothetical protein